MQKGNRMITSNSKLACKDYCIKDAGYTCKTCPRYENTLYFRRGMQKYYKVVCYNVTKNNYCSAVMGKKAGIIYIRNRWVYPRKNCGPLACFDDITAAKDFIGLNQKESPFVIFECEIKKSKYRRIWTNPFNKCVLSLFITGYKLQHTVLADRIKLIREIK
jgi:hypothetical protein